MKDNTAGKDEDRNEHPPNSYASASLLSKLLFLWPYNLLKVGKNKIINENDLEEILHSERSDINLSWIENMWKEATKNHSNKLKKANPNPNPNPTLHRVILIDFIKSLWYVQLINAFGLAARIGQAVSLGHLIQYFSDREKNEANTTTTNGYFWALSLVLCGIVTLIEHHHVFFRTWRKGMQIRTAAIAAIYAKSHRLSSLGGCHVPTAGSIVNLATNDVERFLSAALFVSYLFWGPVYAIVVLSVGMYLVGPAFAAGFSLLALFVPLQFYLSHKFANLRSTVANITDSRVSLVSQAVSGARVMKMSGWELQFKLLIANVRRKESNRIQQASRLRGLNEAVYFACSIVMYVVIFIVDIKTGGVLTPRKVFSTMTLINVVQFELMKHFSLGVMFVSECFVSITRLSKFLNTPELPHTKSSIQTVPNSFIEKENESSSRIKKSAIAISNMTCHWVPPIDSSNEEKTADSNEDSSAKSKPDVALSDIDINVKYGELVCVIGSVGSGKSALILAMTGELPLTSGNMTYGSQSISYASQEPFLMDGTVKENILMGLEFNPDWYEQVVASCGLNEDLRQFQNGDQTIVGDRGVQCSGGQRARISLARAIYRDADIILLDDPLSAVDVNVGRLLFFSAIQDLCVKRGKCVVLATHQHQFIGESRCVLMSKGRIKCVGTYDDCLSASEGTLVNSMHHSSSGNLVAFEKSQKDALSETKLKKSKDDQEKGDERIDHTNDSHREQRNSGVVKLTTFLNYIKAMGGPIIILGLLVLFAATQTSVLFTVIIVGDWAEQSQDEQKSTHRIIYALSMMGAVVILSIVRSVLGFYFAIKASQRLHDKMLGAVLRAKIEFFDCNPLGRILNRFSADVGIVDDLLPVTLFDVTMCSFLVLGGVVTTAFVLPVVLVAFPPIIYYFVSVQQTFLSTSRELKRMEGVARSPIFALLSESLTGIATIRTNNAQKYFLEKFEEKLNNHTRAFWCFIASSRWLGFRMDFMMLALLTAASFAGVIVNDQKWFTVNPSVLGLSLMMVIQLGAIFQWTVRQTAEVVNQMVSVERMVEFSTLTSEAPLHMEEDKKHPNWPTAGKIDVKSLSLRYRANLPPSLVDAGFVIKGGERVGIVGRTGAGKSTFTQGLLRLLEAEMGKIFVDDVDISKLGLHKLRTQMSVIPQTPILFNGCSIRENLDPFSMYDDDTIRKALKDVQMIDVVENLSGQLDSIVAEGGSNFSVGQRQLLCLARAILRKNQILVLDEPTANVDSRTDELLQEAVSKSFPSATIIAIAHRLDTVIEYDKILVLGRGKVLEYGAPHELLQLDGHFKSMVNDSGDVMSAELHRRASIAYAHKLYK